jgi:hypothetical protein
MMTPKTSDRKRDDDCNGSNDRSDEEGVEEHPGIGAVAEQGGIVLKTRFGLGHAAQQQPDDRHDEKQSDQDQGGQQAAEAGGHSERCKTVTCIDRHDGNPGW